MEVIGRLSKKCPDPALLKSIVVEGRPEELPSSDELCVIFGYERDFGLHEKDVDIALVYCETLEEMQKCYDNISGKYPIYWYLADPTRGEPELVPVDMDDLDIEDDISGDSED